MARDDRKIQKKIMSEISSPVESIPEATVIKMNHLRRNHPSGKALFRRLLVRIDSCNQEQYYYSETFEDICIQK